MLKIIYGVKENSSDCELIYPVQDKTGVLNLVKQNIIKNDSSEATVNNWVYAIHCVNDYFVFSKINIVYAHGKRISYRAFMIAIKSTETGCEILKELDKLENAYSSKKTSSIKQQSKEKIKNNRAHSSKNQSVAVYYNEMDELKSYFKTARNYKDYETIYFIDKKLEGSEKDPINALKYNKMIDIALLKANEKSTKTVNWNTGSYFKYGTRKTISVFDIVVCLLIGGGGIFFLANKYLLFTDKIELFYVGCLLTGVLLGKHLFPAHNRTKNTIADDIPKQKKKSIIKNVLFGIICLLLGVCIGIGGILGYCHLFQKETNTEEIVETNKCNENVLDVALHETCLKERDSIMKISTDSIRVLNDSIKKLNDSIKVYDSISQSNNQTNN